ILFFFQAEDGIRYFHVTGVQTCALPISILGKFGTGGVPSLRTVPFRQRLITQTGGGAAYWTGEAKPKGLTSFNFVSTTLEPLKEIGRASCRGRAKPA